MDEVREFCRRVLGPGPLAVAAATEAQATENSGRVELLAAAARACRSQAGRSEALETVGAGSPAEGARPAPKGSSADAARSAAQPGAEGSGAPGLARAVARELASATAALPERQREALVLRELLRLSHEQIAMVVGVDATAVAPLLARARLGLRAERRGVRGAPDPACADTERALRVLTCRQDSEPISVADDDWLPEHLGSCAQCRRAHAAMLEASVCYRAWPAGEPRRSRVGRTISAAPADPAA